MARVRRCSLIVSLLLLLTACGSRPTVHAKAPVWHVLGHLALSPEVKLSDVAALDARTVFVVGALQRGNSAKAIAQRWDGGRWEEIDAGLPTQDFNGILAEVVASSTGGVWALLTVYPQISRNAARGSWISRVYRWSGSFWQQVHAFTGDLPLWGGRVLSVTQDGQVWLGSRGFSEHWNGRYWRSEPTPSNCGCVISQITTESDGTTWALTERADGGDVVTGVLRWEGHAWQVVPAPSGIRFYGIAAVPPNGAWVLGSRCLSPVIIHSGEVVCNGTLENLALRVGGGSRSEQELPWGWGGPIRMATSGYRVWLDPAEGGSVYYDGGHWSRALGVKDPAGTCAPADPQSPQPVASVPGTHAFMVVGTTRNHSGPCVAIGAPITRTGGN